MADNLPSWCTTPFQKADLDGKMVFFTMPTNNQYYAGNLHVLAVNEQGQMQIDIDYGRPLPDGDADSGKISIDQAWADLLEENIDPIIQTDFIIRPLH